MYYLIAPAKSFHQTESLLTYSDDGCELCGALDENSALRTTKTPAPLAHLSPGHIVEIPLGKKTVVGIVVKSCPKPDFDTKPITKLLYAKPLPEKLLKSLQWLEDYYRCPMSSVIQAALPRGVNKKRRKAKTEAASAAKTSKSAATTAESAKTPQAAADFPLNSAQKHSIEQIQANIANPKAPSTFMLHGITGSGKTNIYLKLTQDTLAQGKSVILLVPEIALTSQLVHNFQQHFTNITLLHSELTESLRHQLWIKILNENNPQIIIGPRSALFAPVHNLGLIIIDEAHEPSYLQEQNPKYNALRLAPQLAKTLLGSATPLVSDYYICQAHQAITTLDQLATQNNKKTEIKLIDLKSRQHFTRSRILSTPLLESIQKSLDNHKQSMLFHNRRGTAPLTVCDKCGWQALCSNCYLPLVLHADQFKMTCHTCGRNFPVPTSCPECKNASIHHKGFGTKLLEQEISRLFPNAHIARFDADTENDQQLNKIYQDVHAGKIDIIIGTQMIAKGFDFPLLATLGVVQADAGLSLPDYSSEERSYQLITQVIGRANRGHQNSQIFIQSYQPEHPIMNFAIQNNYSDFYDYLIQKRKQSVLPPYSFLLKLSLTYKTESIAVRNMRQLYKIVMRNVQKQGLKNFIATPPMPAFHERTNTGYTWQIILKAKSRKDLLNIFDSLPKNPYMHYIFDPISLL